MKIMGDTSPEQVDLVVIGAGIYGIQAARTCLEIHPHKNVVILEASNAVGGVWSRGIALSSKCKVQFG